MILITSIIGSSTLLFRAGLIIAKLTKTDKDNKFFNKGLNILGIIAGNVSKIEKNIIIKKK
jgi:hypothetical protein